jgi:hypothetical protein
MHFPHRGLPVKPGTSIEIDLLEEMILNRKAKITSHQYEQSIKAVDYLQHSAPAHQKSALAGYFVRNSASTFKHGQIVTDNIATWINERFAAGPFDYPPCKDFRVNPLLAVVQPGKVRPVLDVSTPNCASFNDIMDKSETEKVYMASAKILAQNILACEKDAVMSKHELVAAYKQIPCRIEDLRLQDSCRLVNTFWRLGKYLAPKHQYATSTF